jgi:uroporphyrinogen III methyltransferase/synthase
MSDGLNSGSRNQASKPLAGKTILITRARRQAEEFAQALELAGATVTCFPTIEIAPPESWSDCERAIRHLHTYDVVVFTSVNAVESFFARALVADVWSPSTIRQKRIYAVGEKTKSALESHGCRVEDVPQKATAEELGHLLKRIDLRGKRVLFPRGNLGTQIFPKLLQQSGATIDEVIVYRTQKPEVKDVESIQKTLANQAIDVVTFFSPSSVRNFTELITPARLDDVAVGVIGEVTAAAAREAGIRVDVIPPNPTSESMVSSLIDFFVPQTTTGTV